MADTLPLLDENFNEIVRESDPRLKRKPVKNIVTRDASPDIFDIANDVKPISVESMPVKEPLVEVSNDLTNGIESPVIDFYKERSIFITGATGFMGKVLVVFNIESARSFILKKVVKKVLIISYPFRYSSSLNIALTSSEFIW